MVLINMTRKCLWARHILRFICKIIQSLPTNDREGGWKMMQAHHGSPTWIDAEDWRPHLSQRCSNCIVGSFLSSARALSLPHPPPFSCADNARLNEAVWRGGNYRLLSLSPGATREAAEWEGGGISHPWGLSIPTVLRWMAGWLSCCQRQVESSSWIRGFTLWVIVRNEVMHCSVWRCLRIDGWAYDTSMHT